MTVAPDFRHVAHPLLRRVLTDEADRQCHFKLEQATRLTVEALGNDVINDAIPEPALHYRIEMAAAARDALRAGQLRKAHSALQQFWLV